MNGEDAKGKIADRYKLAEWLVGEESPPGAPLAASSDAGPEALIDAALAEIEPEIKSPAQCRNFECCLPDYVALGDEAADRMPAVREHLDRCAHCAAELQVIRRVRDDLTSWNSLAALVGKPARRLVLAGSIWHWLSSTGRRLVPLSSEDLILGRRVAGWQLQQRQANALSFKQGHESLPHLALAAPLEEVRSRIHLQVTPEFLPTVHNFVWRVRLELERGASTERMRAGLGDDQRATKGWRTLGPEKPVEFQVEAPGDGNYWLHLEWTDSRGEIIQKKLEIPLGNVSEDMV